MTAIQPFRDSVLLAAALVALLLVTSTDAAPPAMQAEREMHALTRAVDDRLFDSLSGTQVAQHDRVAGFPAIDEDCADREEGALDGHARLTPDERRADLLLRPAQAWLLPGSAPRLVVIPPPGTRGTATLTVRPARGMTEVVALGPLSTSPIVVPLAAPLSSEQLAGGAIELETVDAGRVVWTTLPFVQPIAVEATAFVR